MGELLRSSSITALSVLLIASIAYSQNLESPCNGVFTYSDIVTNNQKVYGKAWYGKLRLSTNNELDGITIEITLNKPSQLLGNSLGIVTSKDNKVYKIENYEEKLRPGQTKVVRIFVKNSKTEEHSVIEKIQLNGRTICAKSGAIDPDPLISKPTISPFMNGGTITIETSVVTEVKTTITCGTRVPSSIPLITYAQPTYPGQFPWHVAIYRSVDINPQYICGGTLVTLRHIITAAHCVNVEHAGIRHPSMLSIFLGKHRLSDWGMTYQSIPVQSIQIHPQFEIATLNNDLAIIILTTDAKYTDYVRPACLWEGEKDISRIYNHNGTIVGWGKDENDKLVNTLQRANIPVIPIDRCIDSNPSFYRKLSSSSYCAGLRNGTSACGGDSGGGMVFRRGNSDVWQLRGVVSRTIPDENNTCDRLQYTVFTDVVKLDDFVRTGTQIRT